MSQSIVNLSTRGRPGLRFSSSFDRSARTFPRTDLHVSPLIWLAVLALCACPILRAQEAKPKSDSSKPSTTCRLRIEVTGGEQKKPVADASVYVKYGDEEKILKGKAIELNLKTNQEGVARSPLIPKGRILIQIIAPGWKTYGEWHDVTEDEQTVSIQLVRPPTKWY